MPPLKIYEHITIGFQLYLLFIAKTYVLDEGDYIIRLTVKTMKDSDCKIFTDN